MTSKKFSLVLILFQFIFCGVFAQGIGIGEWRDHLPYKKTIAVAKIDSKVYCATPYSLFYLNLSDNSIHRLNKINGLSDFGISTMKYDKSHDILLIAYSNANIDLIYDGKILNIPDIKRANILGNKTINNILYHEDYAYLSCGFGIVVLDLIKEEIKDTYYIGPEGNQINVMDLTVNDTSFLAATEEGIFFADINDPNLANFAAWKKLNSSPAPNANHNLILSYDNLLFTNIVYESQDTDTLYVFDGQNWSSFQTGETYKTRNLGISDGFLMISSNIQLLLYDNQLNLQHKIAAPFIPGTLNHLNLEPSDAIVDGELVWIADGKNGLVKALEWGTYATTTMPEGPPSTNAFKLAQAGENIWVAPGGKTEVWSAVFNGEGVFEFYNENWKQYNGYNYPEISGLHDFIDIVADPADPEHVFAACFRNTKGIAEFRNNEVVNTYNEENSELQKWQAANSFAITGIDFDSHGNLWAANSGAPNILSVRINDGTTDGEWYSFNLGSSLSGIDIGSLIVDNNDQKWIIKRKRIESPYYLIVFTDNGTIDNPDDDEYKGLSGSPGTGNIQGNKVFSIACDQDGEIWIGTDNGISVIYSPENVFTGGNYDAQRIIIPRNDGTGLGDILLENEFITCITVDGDNNKWIGTDNAGVFLLSPDGMNEIYHFTEEDSPLFSNLITDIAINNNGEVFIGTSKGIISFRGESAPPEDTFTDVYAYPNPVREGYTGKIGIKGLVKDADVKITDISGNLIYETRSFGGQAVWNGRNFDGRRAKTGVYLVFIANEDGTETIATKILVIN